MAFKFSSVHVETMAKYLCSVIYLSNSEGYLCGHESDQVYGGAYNALKALLHNEIGVRATEIAMNSRTWDYHDFAGQILPAIDEGIEEAKNEERIEKGKKILDFLTKIDNKYDYEFYHSDHYISVFNDDYNHVASINIDWNDVHAWLDGIK